MGIPLIFQVSHYSILISFLLGILTYFRLSTPGKYLAALIAVGTFTEFVSTSVSGSNHWIMNLYDIVEFIFLMIIFYKFKDVVKSKKTVFTFIGIFLFFRIFFLFIEIESVFDFKSHTQIFSNLLLIFLAMLSMFLSKKSNKSLLTNNSKFWILTGVILYIWASFIVTMAILIFGNEIIIKVYHIHAYTNIICNCIFAYAFFLDFKENKLEMSKLADDRFSS